MTLSALADHLASAIAHDNSTSPTLQEVMDNSPSKTDEDLLLDVSFLPNNEIDWDLVSDLESYGLLQTSPVPTLENYAPPLSSLH